MKLKENYVLRPVADTWVALPLEAETLNFNGMLTLNESGVLLWKALEKGGSAFIKAIEVEKDGKDDIKINGKKEILSIDIKPEIVDPDDIEMLALAAYTLL